MSLKKNRPTKMKAFRIQFEIFFMKKINRSKTTDKKKHQLFYDKHSGIFLHLMN